MFCMTQFGSMKHGDENDDKTECAGYEIVIPIPILILIFCGKSESAIAIESKSRIEGKKRAHRPR
jgi:hypothetical protein